MGGDDPAFCRNDDLFQKETLAIGLENNVIARQHYSPNYSHCILIFCYFVLETNKINEMKSTDLWIFAVLLFSMGCLWAQNPGREISQETTEKKYEVYEEGQLVKKSVKIQTVIRQDVEFDTLVENKIDARRIDTPKKITKTVSIDNDMDPEYDETIKFSYASDAKKDFLVNVNDDEIFKALEKSKYLNVKDKKDMSEENLNEMIVITGDDGKVIQLILEESKSQE